jgi:lipid A ethanolaminephosphotransferase
MKKFFSKEFTQAQVILFSAIYLVLFDNWSFFTRSYEDFHNILFLIALGVVLTSVIVLVFTLISNRFIIKPLLIFIFIASAAASYFMNNYGTIFDDKMIQNMLETDSKEAGGLLNLSLIIQVFILGVIPSIILYFVKIKKRSLKDELISRIKYIFGSLAVIIVTFFLFSKIFISFFREHKMLRKYTNPTVYIYNFGKYINETYLTKPLPFKKIGLDAKIEPTTKKQKLFIFVLGEAGRYDHFALNGYKRDTTPNLLKVSDLINYPNLHSCGTETAVSVPCMFSPYDRSNYSDRKAKSTESVIDVLTHAGVNVLWRDNDSGSKKVASRIKGYEDYNDAKDPKFCNEGGCYDDILLQGLQKEVSEVNNSKPIFIVLHTKGSHGPKYFERYPKSFQKWEPICKTNQLQDCTKEQINNTYDGTILYTDHFLDEVIKFLKKNQNKYSVGMFYVADHGESLGENGIYLHGLPYVIAPDVQKHPAAVAWFGDDYDINKTCAKNLANKAYSHDNIFSTILGVMGVKTKVYNPNEDMYLKCYKK